MGLSLHAWISSGLYGNKGREAGEGMEFLGVIGALCTLLSFSLAGSHQDTAHVARWLFTTGGVLQLCFIARGCTYYASIEL